MVKFGDAVLVPGVATVVENGHVQSSSSSSRSEIFSGSITCPQLAQMKMTKGSSPMASQWVAHSVQVIVHPHIGHIDLGTAASLAFAKRIGHMRCRGL